MTPCSVPGGGFLYTIIVPGGGFLLPSSRVPQVCPGEGMVLDEIDTCIRMVENIPPPSSPYRVKAVPNICHCSAQISPNQLPAGKFNYSNRDNITFFEIFEAFPICQESPDHLFSLSFNWSLICCSMLFYLRDSLSFTK